MINLKSLCTLILSCALLSSCATHSPSSPVSNATREEFSSEEEKHLSDEEMDDLSLEETTRAPRPQVVQIPSKS